MSEIDNFEALLQRRHSCRAFLARSVPKAKIEQIVRSAGRVPSWCNAQPWLATITDSGETEQFRAALGAYIEANPAAPDLPFPAQYTGAHQERRRACGHQLYDAVGIAKGDRVASNAQMMQNFTFFGAPHVALITSGKELGAYGALDCGSFISAFTLAAEALGIASIAQAAIAAYAPLVRDHFGIAPDRTILCAISFGYEDTAHPANTFRTPRAPLDDILDWRGST